MEALNNTVHDLPNELWLKIFSYLCHKNLQNVSLVCKNWYELTHTGNLLNKSILVLNPSNWCTLRENLKDDKSYTKIINYTNVHMDSIASSHSDLKLLKYLRHNVKHLVIRKCQFPINLNGVYLFPNLLSLDIDDETLCYEQSISLGSLYLKRLRMNFSDQYSTQNALKLLQNVSETINELELSGPGREISSNSLTNTFQLINNLKVLKINHVSYYNLQTILQSLSSEMNHLENIRLLSFTPIKDNSLRIITEKWLHSLKEISLIGCPEVTDNLSTYLNIIKRNLIHLDLSCCIGLTAQGILRGIADRTNTVLQALNLNLVQINEDDVCLLCERLPNLITLSLENCHKAITNKSLAYISDYLVNLQILNVNKSINSVRNNTNANSITSIGNLHCPTLRVLHMRYSEKVTLIDIEELVYKCPALEDLDISSCSTINDVFLLTIATELKRLRILDISWCPSLTKHSIHYITEYCKKLEVLIFYGRNASWGVPELKHKLLKIKPNIFEK